MVENRVVEANFVGDRVNVPADVPVEGVHIDNAWVDVDVSNILPGRTRGARQDYRQLASGDG